MKIANLHSDLLSYLEEDKTRTPFDQESRTSILQMKKGGVGIETFAIFVKTETSSSEKGKKQLEIYRKIVAEKSFGETLTPFLAVENASSFAGEGEELEGCLKHLDTWGKLSYISLTWNGENRFGGGVGSSQGLKRDGMRLLDWMEERGVCIDLSHTSDRLAEEILSRINTQNLSLIPLASHSNFRSVKNHLRNLPDDIAKEIVSLQGVIGLNFVRPFLGGLNIKDFILHIRHAESLGLLDNLCIGADFFDDRKISKELEKERPIFYPGLENAGDFPTFVSLLQDYFPPAVVEKICWKTLSQFYGVKEISLS